MRLVVLATIIIPLVGFLTFRNIHSTFTMNAGDISSTLSLPSEHTQPTIDQVLSEDSRNRTSVLRGGKNQNTTDKSVESSQSVTEISPSATIAKSQEKSEDEFSRRYGISKEHMKEDGLWVQEIGDVLKCPDLSNRGNEANDGKPYTHIPGNDTW
jgi:hypothetical protein